MHLVLQFWDSLKKVTVTCEKEGVISADRKLDRIRPPAPDPAPDPADPDPAPVPVPEAPEAPDGPADGEVAAPGRFPPSSDTCTVHISELHILLGNMHHKYLSHISEAHYIRNAFFATLLLMGTIPTK